MTRTEADPLRLLKRPGPIEPYPAEASDEELAEALGLDPSRVVRYDMNTLGGGPLPGVAAALRDYDPARVVEYGDLAYARLRGALAPQLGVAPLQILPGAGADELIRLVTTAVVGEGDGVLIPTPAFGMFAVEARLAGASVIQLDRAELAVRQAVPDLRQAAEANGARLIWLCTPNNPTGDRYELDEIRALADGLQAVVVADEVYVEFAEADAGVTPGSLSAVQLLDELPNLLVLRSLSKAYGMAGARVGYLVVPPALAERFDAIRLPNSVSALSEAVALGALADAAGARARLEEIVSQRRRLADSLEALGCEVLPSVTNFVTFRAPRDDLAELLGQRGLILRAYEAGPMRGWLRATARGAVENDLLIGALQEILT